MCGESTRIRNNFSHFLYGRLPNFNWIEKKIRIFFSSKNFFLNSICKIKFQNKKRERKVKVKKKRWTQRQSSAPFFLLKPKRKISLKRTSHDDIRRFQSAPTGLPQKFSFFKKWPWRREMVGGGETNKGPIKKTRER